MNTEFIYGVGNSAYQIEGTKNSGNCIWDSFSENENNILDGNNAKLTCDFLNNYKEDIKILKILGIKHYNISINWSRIIPNGIGKINNNAIALYRKIIMLMKENNIKVYISLFHWEYPQELQNMGGWLSENSSKWFLYYSKIVIDNFYDLCDHFITFDQPQCMVDLGYIKGKHAPGYTIPCEMSFKIMYNILKSHGLTVRYIKEKYKKNIKVGISLNTNCAVPKEDENGECTKEDIEAAKRAYFGENNNINNWMWDISSILDPIIKGDFSKDFKKKYKDYIKCFTPKDLEIISEQIDFIGLNIFNGYIVGARKDGNIEIIKNKKGSSITATEWMINSKSIYWSTLFCYERYEMPIFIMEMGMAAIDIIEDERVHDKERIYYLDSYMCEIQKAILKGVDIKGVFVWSFLDGFEWDRGYSKRFGLVHIDFETQKRIIKDSAYWYKDIIDSNGNNLSVNKKLKPILFMKPELKENIWGGEKLKTEFGYNTTVKDIGECWGISAHKNGDDKILNNYFIGKTLSKLWMEKPYLFGNLDSDRFPLLIKIIDAKDNLSIQVHPNDEYAFIHENGSLGKTECWYIIDCPENANLVVGHNAKNKEELEYMIKNNMWDTFIRKINIKKGDFIQIEPGTVHAITAGCMILETQQNCDITYRVYDYDRIFNGEKRQLHIKQSLDVIEVPARDLKKCVVSTNNMPKNQWNLLVECKYYKVYKLTIDKKFIFEQDKDFINMSVISGFGIINGQIIKKGDHFIIPYEYGKVEIDGELEIIASTI